MTLKKYYQKFKMKKIKHIFTFLRNIRIPKIFGLIKFMPLIKALIKIKITNNVQEKICSTEDLFILSCCINQRDGNYFNYNNKQSEYDRFIEVCNSIISVRTIFPNCKIVYLDNSRITIEYEKYLVNIVDDYKNYSDNPLMIEARKIENKGVPWSLTNLLYLVDGIKKYKAVNVHFLNGRYTISNLTLENTKLHSTLNTLYIKFKVFNVSLIYLFFKQVNINLMASYFKAACLLSVTGFSVEDVFAVSRLKTIYLTKLGVHGNINGGMKNSE